MPKSLFPRVEWDRVRAVGFDLDGTLYDEAAFIGQAYAPVSRVLAAAAGLPAGDTLADLTARWRRHGSSYPRIFGDFLADSGVLPDRIPGVVAEALAAYRACEPVLALAPRVAALLDLFAARHPLFLVTDGREAQQRRKFAALGLSRWFLAENAGFCGAHGPEFAKPSPRIAALLPAVPADRGPGEVVYFGDRDVDAVFSVNAGFTFVRVHEMVPAGEPNPA